MGFFVGGQGLTVDQFLQIPPIGTCHRHPVGKGLVLGVQASAVVDLSECLDAQFDHLLGFNHLAIALGWLRADRAAACKTSDGIGNLRQARQIARAVLTHRRLAKHKGARLQGTWHSVVVTRARHIPASHPGERRRYRTATREVQHPADHAAGSVLLHLFDVDGVRAAGIGAVEAHDF